MLFLHEEERMNRTARLPLSVRFPASPVTSPAPALGGLVRIALAWQERRRQRHALQMLDDHLLKDIGLSRADIHREATKRFWQG
jgi:uncharacterized protein YjiS (DUF1127 family)